MRGSEGGRIRGREGTAGGRQKGEERGREGRQGGGGSGGERGQEGEGRRRFSMEGEVIEGEAIEGEGRRRVSIRPRLVVWKWFSFRQQLGE